MFGEEETCFGPKKPEVDWAPHTWHLEKKSLPKNRGRLGTTHLAFKEKGITADPQNLPEGDWAPYTSVVNKNKTRNPGNHNIQNSSTPPQQTKNKRRHTAGNKGCGYRHAQELHKANSRKNQKTTYPRPLPTHQQRMHTILI